MARRMLTAVCLIGAASATLAVTTPDAAQMRQSSGGAIRGLVHLTGPLPGNPVIRMGMDPMCARLNAGKRTVQESVVAALDGSLANVFISLQGTFPKTPVPSSPVVIDQQGCVYRPRVSGVRVGQVLQVRNSDDALYNVHGVSHRANGFNVSQPKAGLRQEFRPTNEETMLRLTCDIHKWMTAFVGVVDHPYFDTTGAGGAFAIDRVPPGDYTISAWHERYGTLSTTAKVRAGTTTTVSFSYPGKNR